MANQLKMAMVTVDTSTVASTSDLLPNIARRPILTTRPLRQPPITYITYRLSGTMYFSAHLEADSRYYSAVVPPPFQRSILYR